MATNGFYQRWGVSTGKSFKKINHFLDKGSALDPVSMDSQKKHLMDFPTENSLQNYREW